MEQQTGRVLPAGFWDNLNPNLERKEPVIFNFGKRETVIMMCDAPREIAWDKGVFYVFDVLHNGQEKVIKTSAFTLLEGLKLLKPFNGKQLIISKEMVNSKQNYTVEEYGGERVGENNS